MPPAVPTLSLVLAVHREQAWIGELIASVFDQDVADVEVIAVDDASPDHAPALLDDLARREPRLRVHHLAERRGVDAARDLGLAEAAGEYVWFVEATDLVAGGSLAGIVERLLSSAPDVLLVPHRRADVLGKQRPGPHSERVARLASHGPATLDQRPGLADLAPRAYDKILRRRYLAALGVGFRHGELGVTWPALLAATSIDAVTQAGYVRREPPNRERAPRAATDVLAAYDDVFEFVAARGDVGAERRALLVAAMLRHELALLRRLPAPERRAFFSRMSEHYRRHRRGDEPAPRGRAGRLQARLVERDRYRAFAALESARGARRTLGRARSRLARRRRRLRGALGRRRIQRYYRRRLREPIDDNLAVFAAYWYRGYACNPRAIYERARELAPALRCVWVVNREGVDGLPPGVEHVVAGSRRYYDVIARARYLVNNVNFPNDVVKRPGSVHVMTHHGTPLKRMGLDEQLSPVSKMNFPALMRRCARWDYSVSANAHSTLVWERVYPLRYETLEVGYPRNDVLATATDDEVQRVRGELGIAPGKTAVL
ncbi:MAG: hypothetical protein QOC68_960, partial [Solirubrobacteraceae bacterium]|nr:hypothetical protein [Solirubrobacteraceae bacterium]